MTEIKDMAALADELDTYAKRYSGDWSNALPSMSWAKLKLIVKALRSASRTGPGFAENLTCHCHDEVSRKYCLDKDRCTPMAEAQAALPAPAKASTPELKPWRDELSEIIGHLGSAITQSVASDDQIIMDHVKAAHEIAKIVRRKA